MKLFYLYILILFLLSFSLTQCANELDENKIKEFIKKKLDQTVNFLDNVQKYFDKQVNSKCELITSIASKGFEDYKSSTSIQKTYGVKLTNLPGFILLLKKRLDLPDDYAENFSVFTREILDELSPQFKTYSFLYDKKTSGNLNYVEIICEKRGELFDMIFTQIKIDYVLKDILIIKKTISNPITGEIKEKIEVVKNSVGFNNEEDIENIMQYFNIVSIKSMGDYFGIKKNLKFLELLK